MTVTIELSPDEERRLQERAARRGQDLTASLRQLIRDDLEAAGRSFAEILAPIHEDFRRSGLSEAELDTLLEGALEEARAQNLLESGG